MIAGRESMVLHLDMEKYACKKSETILAYDYAVNKAKKRLLNNLRKAVSKKSSIYNKMENLLKFA